MYVIEKRKRPTPRMGKGATINARVSNETRAAIEAEALKSGRSISEIVEAWLEEARRGQASLDGVPFANILRAMIWAAQSINAQVGDPTKEEAAFGVLMGAWSTLVDRGLHAPALSGAILSLTDMQPGVIEAAAKVADAIRPVSNGKNQAEVMLGDLRLCTSESGWLNSARWELLAIELRSIDENVGLQTALAGVEQAKAALIAYAAALRPLVEVKARDYDRGRRLAMAFLAPPTKFKDVNLSPENSAEAPGD